MTNDLEAALREAQEVLCEIDDALSAASGEASEKRQSEAQAAGTTNGSENGDLGQVAAAPCPSRPAPSEAPKVK